MSEGEEVVGGGCRERKATMHDRAWTSVGTLVDVAPFTQAVGPNFTVPDDPAGLLFTPELIQHIVSETSHFASVSFSSPGRKGVIVEEDQYGRD